MELKVLGTESAPFVGVIFTVCAPACHSGIRFYSTDWKPIEMPFPTISASDFIAIGLSEDNQAAANRMLTPLFVRYSFEGTNKITATCSARLFPEENGQQELKPLLKSETLTLVYQDGGWKIQQ